MRCRNLSSPPGSLLMPWSSFLYLSCSTGSLSLRGVTPRPGFCSRCCVRRSRPLYSLPRQPRGPGGWFRGSCPARALCRQPFEDSRGWVRRHRARSLHYLRRRGPDHRLRRGSLGPLYRLRRTNQSARAGGLSCTRRPAAHLPDVRLRPGFRSRRERLHFLALFVAASRFLDLRYAATLLGVCFAAFLAVTAGLLLQRPLPALPFIAVAFVLVNADLIVTSLVKRR